MLVRESTKIMAFRWIDIANFAQHEEKGVHALHHPDADGDLAVDI